MCLSSDLELRRRWFGDCPGSSLAARPCLRRRPSVIASSTDALAARRRRSRRAPGPPESPNASAMWTGRVQRVRPDTHSAPLRVGGKRKTEKCPSGTPVAAPPMAIRLVCDTPPAGHMPRARAGTSQGQSACSGKKGCGEPRWKLYSGSSPGYSAFSKSEGPRPRALRRTRPSVPA